MAYTSKFQGTDRFLLNRLDSTYKITFTELTSEILTVINGGNDIGIDADLAGLFVDDLQDASTTLYISGRLETAGPSDPDYNKATTVSPTDVAGTANGTYLDNGVNWILQYAPSSVTGSDGAFVLSDPKDAFKSVAQDLGDALAHLELNDLTDVFTKNADGSYINSAGLNIGNTFLVMTGQTPAVDSNGDPVTDSSGNAIIKPTYQPRLLSETVEDLIQKGELDLSQGLDQIIDINPNPILEDGTTDPIEPAAKAKGRLSINPYWADGVLISGNSGTDSGTINGTEYAKYDYTQTTDLDSGKEDDDIVVYIADPTAMINDPRYTDGTATSNNPQYDASPGFTPTSSPNENLQDLEAGWYFAPNSGDAATGFDEDDLATLTDANEASADMVGDLGITADKATPVDAGVIRVLSKYNPAPGSTVFTDDPSRNVKVLTRTVYDALTTPTNIGITSEGILYSEIPDTLTFVAVVDITGKAETESFGELGDGRLVPVAGSPGKGGPGNANTPTDPLTDPSRGDFYVIRFVDGDTGSDPTDVASEQKTLNWRDDSSNDGSHPDVRDGDMIAWSGTRWSVIGTVNTDTVAQDLQSVTDRGNSTTNDVTVKDLLTTNGVVAGTANIIDHETGASFTGHKMGDVTSSRVNTNNINFDLFPDLK